MPENDAAERAASIFAGYEREIEAAIRHEQDAEGVAEQVADLISHASRIERQRFVDIVVRLIRKGRDDG